MEVREVHPLSGESIDPRGLHDLMPISAEFMIAMVVDENHDDVGLLVRLGCFKARGERENEGQDLEWFHERLC